ncbi:methyltransferase domain-containing protein [Acetobacteraceae bacterium]|nr:methyltransferase domain-containing protein [Candidatus Parcubacteria bacterium]
MEEGSFLHPPKAIAAAGVHEGMHVADFGSGSGFFTRAAARAVGEGGVVWAVDVHQDLLPRIKNLAAAENLHNVEVVHGNVEVSGGSNLPAEQFDLVIAANLLFAAEHKREVVAEMRRVLKKNGRALVIDWSDSFGGLGPHPDHVLTVQAGRELFEQGGFTYVGDISAGAYHWGFIIRKNTNSGAQ